ncbi:hypothetical protein OQA88_699 [Cercophora sp. LCS_1]
MAARIAQPSSGIRLGVEPLFSDRAGANTIVRGSDGREFAVPAAIVNMSAANRRNSEPAILRAILHHCLGLISTEDLQSFATGTLEQFLMDQDFRAELSSARGEPPLYIICGHDIFVRQTHADGIEFEATEEEMRLCDDKRVWDENVKGPYKWRFMTDEPAPHEVRVFGNPRWSSSFSWVGTAVQKMMAHPGQTFIAGLLVASGLCAVSFPGSSVVGNNGKSEAPAHCSWSDTKCDLGDGLHLITDIMQHRVDRDRSQA